MKDKILVILFCVFIFTMGIGGVLLPDEEISKSERRNLADFPKFQFSSSWITNLDKYFLDHFPGRDYFRSVKAIYNYDIIHKLDNNKIYIKDNYIFKSGYPTNKKLIDNFKEKINKLNSLLTPDNRVYMMVIPDKNYYLISKDFLKIDYDYIYNEVYKLGFNNIDIRDLMNLSDYYETDTHWKEERLDKVVRRLSEFMNFNYVPIKYNYNVYNNFYGVYYGESALYRKPEKLVYLTNDLLDNVYVKYLENKNLHSIYNFSKLDSLDAYNVFLDGASSFIEIYNDNSTSSKELVIFRDSFGSSLTPLLVSYYKKITVIDNRYISSDYFKDLIKFDHQDVLFMYSTMFINDSGSLKG